VPRRSPGVIPTGAAFQAKEGTSAQRSLQDGKFLVPLEKTRPFGMTTNHSKMQAESDIQQCMVHAFARLCNLK